VGLGAAPAALLLFYHGLSVPAVVAFGDGGALGERFAAALPLLPPAGFVHAFAEDLALLEHVRRVERHGAMRRMLWTGFPGAVVPPEAAGARRLSAADLPQLTSLYAESYPESYFEPVQLERGLFFGVDAEGELASVAGVHVYSEAEGVAMLGNIATRPAQRGRGLARAATAALAVACARTMRRRCGCTSGWAFARSSSTRKRASGRRLRAPSQARRPAWCYNEVRPAGLAGCRSIRATGAVKCGHGKWRSS
jgi:hypothetical protein